MGGKKVTEKNQFSVYRDPGRHLSPPVWQAELMWTELPSSANTEILTFNRLEKVK